MKFVLFVEGHTEAEGKRFAAYLKRWLDPKLRQPVGINPIRFDGWAELLKDAPIHARTHLEGPKGPEIAGVIGLIDLYGPTIYPSNITTPNDRHDWIRKQVERQVGQQKYRQFCAVHEVEAWLLSQPGIFPREVREALSNTARTPEAVNSAEPPSKLLIRLYEQRLRRTYKKRVDGPNLFDQADPIQAYGKCPHLKQMLDEMLSMAKAAGL
jgi:hypothetical protein